MRELFNGLKEKYLNRWHSNPQRTLIVSIMWALWIIWVLILFVFQITYNFWLFLVFFVLLLILGLISLVLDIVNKCKTEILRDIIFLILVSALYAHRYLFWQIFSKFDIQWLILHKLSIIIVLLTYILKKLNLKHNNVIIINCILLYMFIVSFSPSVIRAGLFSILCIINKQYNLNIKLDNLLYLELFILVIINPFIIYDIGF